MNDHDIANRKGHGREAVMQELSPEMSEKERMTSVFTAAPRTVEGTHMEHYWVRTEELVASHGRRQAVETSKHDEPT